MPLSEIVPAKQENIQSTLSLFHAVTKKMLDENVDQWNYDYPSIEVIEMDIEAKEQYVILDGETVVGTIVLNDSQDEQYHNVHWKSKREKVFVIHRLAVHPDYQNQGIAKKLCQYAEEMAIKHNYLSIRLDAYAGNKGSNRLYQKLGYTRANGFCYFRKKAIPFYCYEKIL